MTDETTTLPRDYTLVEVAAALGMSTRWLRDKIKADHLEHLEYGHKIKFTADQVEAIRDRYTKAPVKGAITTGPAKRAS